MARKTYDRTEKEPWSLAPLWIRPANRLKVELYLFKKGETRNNYFESLIEKDLPRIEKELEEME